MTMWIKHGVVVILVCIIAIVTVMNVYRVTTRTLITSSAADEQFRRSGWGGYQFMRLKLRTTKEIFRKRMHGIFARFEKLQYTNAKCIVRNTFAEFMRTYFSVNPDPEHDTFTIYIIPGEQILGFVGNHATVDGVTMYTVLGTILEFGGTLRAPKYVHVPILSELQVASYVARHLMKCATFKPLPSRDCDRPDRRCSIHFPLDGRKRFEVYGKVLDTLYTCIDTHVKTLRLAFTVAWLDKAPGPAHNRIGAIVLDIPRMENETAYCEFVRREMMKRKTDALSSYELVRSYYVPGARRTFSRNIDGVFTAFVIPSHVPGFQDYFGGFAGSLKSSFYINTMSAVNQKPKPTLAISIQTRAASFSARRLLGMSDTARVYDAEYFPFRKTER